MGKMIVIVISAVLFAVIGLVAGIFAMNQLPNPERIEDSTIALAFLPPAIGAIVGLVVGCVAAAAGRFLTPKQ